MSLRLESFNDTHAHLRCDDLVDFSRAALGKFHASPVGLTLLSEGDEQTIALEFGDVDERMASTYERELVVQMGAIAMAGIAVAQHFGYRIVEVMSRGSHADYFIGPGPDQDPVGVVEISGTDQRDLRRLYQEKQKDVLRSPWPTRFVSVTRFATPAVLSGVVQAEVPRGD